MIATPDTDAARRAVASRRFSTIVSARASSSRTTRRDSSRIGSASSARAARSRCSRRGRVHDRRNRRDHRAADRPAEKRDVPDARPRGPRHPCGRRARSGAAADWRRSRGVRAAAVRRRDARARPGRREGRPRLLHARQSRRAVERHSHARSRRRWSTASPRPRGWPRSTAQASAPLAERIRALFLGRDRIGELLRRTLGADARSTRRRSPTRSPSRSTTSIARCAGDSAGSSGRLKRWDAIGLRAVLDACAVTDPPPLVRRALDAGRDRLREATLPPAAPGRLVLSSTKPRVASSGRTPARASSISATASSAVEFHSKMNTIGGDTIEMMHAGLAEAAERTSRS